MICIIVDYQMLLKLCLKLKRKFTQIGGIFYDILYQHINGIVIHNRYAIPIIGKEVTNILAGNA